MTHASFAVEEGNEGTARPADFDRFFEVLVKCKEAEGIVNSATAELRMVEIVEEYLAAKAQNDREQREREGGETNRLPSPVVA